MLQTTRQDTQSSRPGGKVTDIEGEEGRRRHPERARTKSFGTGDVTRWRSGSRPETVGT